MAIDPKNAATGLRFNDAGLVCAVVQQYDSKEVLMETDPATFWQTPHYDGWAGLLVRYDSADPDRVASVIERAHGQAAARKPARPRKA